MQTEYHAGQGVVYRWEENGGYIVTAGHVLEGLQEAEHCTVIFADGKEVSAEMIYQSGTADVAFLRVDAVLTEEEQYGTVTQAAMDKGHFDALKEGDALYFISIEKEPFSRIEGTLVSPWIYLEDFSLNMMLVKIDCSPGMSGCGIYDENGYFMGILCGVDEEGEAAVLPLSVIESEWILAGEL